MHTSSFTINLSRILGDSNQLGFFLSNDFSPDQSTPIQQDRRGTEVLHPFDRAFAGRGDEDFSVVSAAEVEKGWDRLIMVVILSGLSFADEVSVTGDGRKSKLSKEVQKKRRRFERCHFLSGVK